MDNVYQKILLALVGVLAPHLRTLDGPLSTSGIFLPQVSAESPSNISPNPSDVISEVSELYDKPFLDIFDFNIFVT